MQALPIDPVLPDIVDALTSRGLCVLSAPPGAGKTTRVPLALLDKVKGKILMLEPRRVAARAAAERLATELGEKLGQSVGVRMRGQSVPGARIEVVTDGILTRLLQSDPSLDGIGCIIFDEFHERSMQADLGLGFVLESRNALREDLAVLVMSATLDVAAIAALLGGAPVVEAAGRSFPVGLVYAERPVGMLKGRDFVRSAVDLVMRAVAEQDGGALVFLPGEGEIRQVANALDGRIRDVDIMPLYGALPFAAQQAAIAPGSGRKLVLATSIAETSLTIQDITVVVDCGLARRSIFDPGNGMARLVTERVSRAEAEQRRGRAGRVAAGVCYRMWARGEEGALQAFAAPEIAQADLAGLALDLAMWGARDAENLALLTPPPEGLLAEARGLLRRLGALDDSGAITAHGQAIARLPVHPRLAHMVLRGGKGAAELAAICEERSVLKPARVDLVPQLRRLRGEKGIGETDHAALARAREGTKRLRRFEAGAEHSSGAQLSLAFPDRIALRRKGDEPRYLLSGGAGAILDREDTLAGARMLVAFDLDGDRREARIRRAIAVDEAEIRQVHADRITEVKLCEWSAREQRVKATVQTRLGALVLAEKTWKDASDALVLPALMDGVRATGLKVLDWSKSNTRLRARVEWLRNQGESMPDMSDEGLLSGLENWLGYTLNFFFIGNINFIKLFCKNFL